MSRVSKKRRLGLRNLREVSLPLTSMTLTTTAVSYATASPIAGYLDSASYVITTANATLANVVTVTNTTTSTDAAATITIGATAALASGVNTVFTTKPRVSKGDVITALSDGASGPGVALFAVTVREYA